MFWKKLDSILTKIEMKGFKVANKAHIYAVNGLLLLFAYNAVTVFRDYNTFFLEARVPYAYIQRKKSRQTSMMTLNPTIPSTRNFEEIDKNKFIILSSFALHLILLRILHLVGHLYHKRILLRVCLSPTSPLVHISEYSNSHSVRKSF